MRLISALVMTALTIVLCGICITVHSRRKKNTTERMVCEPYFIAVLGMVGGLIMCVPAVVTAIEGRADSYGFLAFPLLGWFLIVIYLNCVVRYDQTGFRCRNFFGITRNCDYRDVEGLRVGKDIRIFFHGRSYVLDGSCDGVYPFLQTLKRGYQKAYGRPVPDGLSYGRRFDPMNGHLEYPWFYLLTGVFFGLASIAILGVCIYSFYHVPNPDKLHYEEVAFHTYEVQDKRLYLYAENREDPFWIDLYTSYNALPDPESFCSGEVYQVGTNGKNDEIRSLIGADGAAYVTPELWLAVYRQDQIIALPFLVLFCLASVAFMSLFIAVGRHPERYPERVRKLVYREGQLLNLSEEGSH